MRPVWQPGSQRVERIEVLPLEQLGRPRVDVTLRISGLFRDAFPQLVAWMDRATRRIAACISPVSGGLRQTRRITDRRGAQKLAWIRSSRTRPPVAGAWANFPSPT